MKDDSDQPILTDLEPVATAPRRRGAPAGRRRSSRPDTTKPTHYKVICISMYTRDIEALEAKVAELKRRGFTKANKSQLIRIALSQLELEALGASPDVLEKAA